MFAIKYKPSVNRNQLLFVISDHTENSENLGWSSGWITPNSQVSKSKSLNDAYYIT